MAAAAAGLNDIVCAPQKLHRLLDWLDPQLQSMHGVDRAALLLSAQFVLALIGAGACLVVGAYSMNFVMLRIVLPVLTFTAVVCGKLLGWIAKQVLFIVLLLACIVALVLGVCYWFIGRLPTEREIYHLPLLWIWK